jgi:hypothetical protein
MKMVSAKNTFPALLYDSLKCRASSNSKVLTCGKEAVVIVYLPYGF